MESSSQTNHPKNRVRNRVARFCRSRISCAAWKSAVSHCAGLQPMVCGEYQKHDLLGEHLKQKTIGTNTFWHGSWLSILWDWFLHQGCLILQTPEQNGFQSILQRKNALTQIRMWESKTPNEKSFGKLPCNFEDSGVPKNFSSSKKGGQLYTSSLATRSHHSSHIPRVRADPFTLRVIYIFVTSKGFFKVRLPLLYLLGILESAHSCGKSYKKLAGRCSFRNWWDK